MADFFNYGISLHHPLLRKQENRVTHRRSANTGQHFKKKNTGPIYFSDVASPYVSGPPREPTADRCCLGGVRLMNSGLLHHLP
jgi:hypothetical protein